MGFSDERLAELGYGYDLDGGGYAFENASGLDGVVQDDSGTLAGYFDSPDHDLALFSVGGFDDLPAVYRTEDSRYRRVFRGTLNGSDRPCGCSGCLSDSPDAMPLDRAEIASAIDAGAALDPDNDGPATGWVWSGDLDPDNAFPHCPRCDGDGYVDSEGGEVGLYRLADLDGGDRIVRWRSGRLTRI